MQYPDRRKIGRGEGTPSSRTSGSIGRTLREIKAADTNQGIEEPASFKTRALGKRNNTRSWEYRCGVMSIIARKFPIHKTAEACASWFRKVFIQTVSKPITTTRASQT